MANAIKNFWESAWGKWVLGLLSFAVIAGTTASVTGAITQAVMAEKMATHILANEKDFDRQERELTEIQGKLDDLSKAVERSSTQMQMHMSQKDAHK